MKKLIIGPGRISFPFLFKEQPPEFGGKYAMTLLLPPTLDTSLIVKALTQAAVEKFGPDKKKWPKGMILPEAVIKNAENKSHITGYEPGWKFISLKSKIKPSVVDASLAKVEDEKEAYAGRWARVSASAYAFDTILKGVGLGLHNVQLMKHDTPFSAASKPSVDFDAIAEEVGSADSDWVEARA